MKQAGDQHNGTLTINLMNKNQIQKPVQQFVNDARIFSAMPSCVMTIEQLRQNYEFILNTKAIFYPVPYQILCEIGSGRQGTVLFALRHGARGCITEHAVKLFDPRLYRSVGEYWTDMGRIAYQVSQLHRLQSPNLVSTDNYEETYGIGYIQMEAIDGLDVSRLMAKETLEIARKGSTSKEWAKFTATIFRIEDERICLQAGVAVHILRAVLRGLERVHALHFLHADIKPTNIMIDRLGDIKLVDFGRAAIIGEKATFLLGSPMYMAPETHRREPTTVLSDCYSLGLVALEMLTGRRITENDNPTEEELLRIKMDLPNRFSDILPKHLLANDALMHVLCKFLAPDPSLRYPSAREAESGEEGLKVISKQLVQASLDAEYARELSRFISTFANTDEQRVDDRLPRVLLRLHHASYEWPRQARDTGAPSANEGDL